jgi:quinol monooxygenase YgiN
MKWADGVAGSIDRTIEHALPSPDKIKCKTKISGSEMRLTVRLLLAMALVPSFVHAARAEGAAGPIHVATYVEVGTSSDKDGIKLLQQYRDASRKEAGNMRSEVAQELGRPNRFVVLEIWKDQAAADAHGKSAGTSAFRDKLKTIQNGPYDERVHSALAVGANDPITARRAVYVASHVDVPPPKKDDVIAALNVLAEASRKGDGNLRFEVVQQTSRPNHFTVIETWKDHKAYDARGSAAAQRKFREALGPMLGALYDERIYRPVD